ncbi:porin [Pyxidicoccus xibeiensis]|uniref:porin n=1 Tax=Pyxidicoccus xibeiensis TaxID=2906759 RepID=UPI0020A7C80E|nr:porin [Pyxidicoccus xibeiensis]
MRPAPLRPLSLLAALVALWTAGPAAAARIPLGEEASLNVGILLQPQLQLIEDGAPVGAVGTDLYLRRIRLIVGGTITKKLSFFAEIDQPNFGKDGNFNVTLFVQDAYLSYEFADKIWVEAGLLLAPLSHHSLQGATSLNTVDYHSSLIRYPATVGKIWRDTGAQVRGFAGPLHFRAAIFNGAEGTTRENAPAINPDDLPRGLAHVRWNFLGREEDFFFKGIYFADKPLLSVGAGVDYQPSAVGSATGVHDALALALDVFFDLPLPDDQEVVFQTNVFHYRQGFDVPQSGTGFFTELGWRFGQLQPVLSAEYFHSRVANQDLLALRPGFNLWFQKHTLNLKTEVALARVGDISEAETAITGTAQLQLFY